ncbi:MAG: GntR family transcriptional regulator [Caldilineales bacterium]|nr:GntR family transcriptional regulator [Caldilineales bacterium]
MDTTPLYQQIAEAVRQEILYGQLRPGDSLPTVREMAERWQCTPGTVQRAYRELVRQGVVVSQPGQGTRVGSTLTSDAGPLRRAELVHRAEAFLLQQLAAGYSAEEIERAERSALDRWRAQNTRPQSVPTAVLRFAGSHDLAISQIGARFGEIAPGFELNLTYNGSLGGLIALARGDADLAGSHLWDAESEQYNLPTVRRLMPGQRVALVTLAFRRLGLVSPPGNPLGVDGLTDLPGRRFANRQRGAGTRVWLEAQLRRSGIDSGAIAGFDHEATTHTEVARLVAEGESDTGLAIEAAAKDFGLDFLPLTTERYDLVIPATAWDNNGIQALVRWLRSDEGCDMLEALGGYETGETGGVRWVD